MNILIAEDDYASKRFLIKLLTPYGKCDETSDGIETVEAFVTAHEIRKPYDLLCLDIMMPKIDGLKALKTIREYEMKKGVSESEQCKVIITSALSESEVSYMSTNPEHEVYVVKPFNVETFKDAMRKLGLLQDNAKK